MARPLLLGLCAALAASSTAAADTRFPRTQHVVVEVKLSDRVKPAPAAPKAAPAAPAGPALTADDVVSLPGLTSAVRADQEQILVQLIENTPDSEVEEKTDFYFRLGELYSKQQHLFRVQAAEAATAVDKATTTQQKAQLQQAASTAANTAKTYLLKAVKTWKGLTDNDAFRNYPKMDMALFYYGYTLQGGKYMKEARAVYDKLLKDYPNSKYVPEAHLVFGDYYFDANQLADAEARYKMCLKFPKSSAYWYATYKLGWIHLDLQRYQEALETFFQVAQATRNDQHQAALNGASKRDFVRAYAAIGKPDRALATFQRVDPAVAADLGAELATQFADAGRLAEAVALDRELLLRTPTDARACAWQYRIAHTLLSVPGSTTADRVREIEKLVARHQAAPDDAECTANAAAMAGELARAYHHEALLTHDTDTLDAAVKLYRAYAEGIPDGDDHAEIEWLAAEASWTRAELEPNAKLRPDRWEQAAQAFSAVTSDDPDRAKEAAEATVLAWENALDIDPSPAAQLGAIDLAKRPGKLPAPRALPKREAALVAAIDVYASFVAGGSDEAAWLQFLAAAIEHRRGDHDAVVSRLEALLSGHPGRVVVEPATELELDSLAQLHRYDELRARADVIAGDLDFLADKPQLAKLVGYIRTHSFARR